jgi:hypothetical protein
MTTKTLVVLAVIGVALLYVLDAALEMAENSLFGGI